MSRAWLRASYFLLWASACGADASGENERADGTLTGSDHAPDAATDEDDRGGDDDTSPACDAGAGGNVITFNGSFVNNGSGNTFTCGGAGAALRGNGKLVSEAREVGAFSGVQITDALQGTLKVGAPALRLDVDENLIAHIATRVRDGILEIGNVDPRTPLLPSPEARIHVAAPQLSRIAAHGAASLRGASAGTSMTLEATGSSVLALELAVTSTLSASASGSAQVRLEGGAPTQVIIASGAAHLRSALASTEVEVQASGAAQVEVRATRRVRVIATGAARVTVLGEPPDREIDTNGTASISFVK